MTYRFDVEWENAISLAATHWARLRTRLCTVVEPFRDSHLRRRRGKEGVVLVDMSLKRIKRIEARLRLFAI